MIVTYNASADIIGNGCASLNKAVKAHGLERYNVQRLESGVWRHKTKGLYFIDANQTAAQCFIKRLRINLLLNDAQISSVQLDVLEAFIKNHFHA